MKNNPLYKEAHLIFSGLAVIINDKMCVTKIWVQTKFPRSKKKRIRNKWAKKYKGNFKYGYWNEEHKIYKMNGYIMCSTKTFNSLREGNENGIY